MQTENTDLAHVKRETENQLYIEVMEVFKAFQRYRHNTR